MARKFDPFTMQWIETDPDYIVWQPNSNHPAPPERGTINHEGRADRFILDMPSRRSEPGCGGEAEKPRPTIIRG